MNLLKVYLIATSLMFATASCTKEVVVEKQTDELTRNKSLHYGTWKFYQHEIEWYSGLTMMSKKVETFTNFTVEWKKDGTYIHNSNGVVQTGTWDLTSPSVFVYDKLSAGDERYYYIVRLDSNFYYRKGPYKKNGGMYADFLAVEYYKK